MNISLSFCLFWHTPTQRHQQRPTKKGIDRKYCTYNVRNIHNMVKIENTYYNLFKNFIKMNYYDLFNLFVSERIWRWKWKHLNQTWTCLVVVVLASVFYKHIIIFKTHKSLNISFKYSVKNLVIRKLFIFYLHLALYWIKNWR